MSDLLNARDQRKSLKTLRILAFLVVTIVTMGLLAQDAYAVRVSLQRVIFAGSKRSETLTLINNTAKDQTYRLGWKKFRMDEQQSLRAIEEGAPFDDILWAEKMVRFAPRRITVAAGASQQVRIMLRRPKELADGEYRAHLWIVSEGEPPKFEADPDSTKQAIRLSVQPAISLPIFVRTGDLSGEANFSDVTLKPIEGGLSTSFTLNRVGDRSIYGDFDFVCTDGGKDVVLRQARGIAVYKEIDRRFLRYDLPLNETTTRSCNTVGITFRSSPNDPQFKGVTLAETSVSH